MGLARRSRGRALVRLPAADRERAGASIRETAGVSELEAARMQQTCGALSMTTLST